MIILDCSNCGQTLEIDDAFAGGVCRCRHCGTIQTVPVDGEHMPSSTGTTTSTSKGAVPLYRREEQHEDGTSGLDELADVVASSGSLSSGLYRTSRSRTRKGRGADEAARDRSAGSRGRPPADRRLIFTIGLAAILAVIAAILAIILLTDASETDGASPEATNQPPAEFLDLPLGRSVAFVVDRGQNSATVFGVVNDLILETIVQMPLGSEFQIIYWLRPEVDAQGDPPTVPSRAMRTVSPVSLSEARRKIDEIDTGGSTIALPAVEVALRSRADTIVLITGKGQDLPNGFADEILRRRGDEPVAIHTLAVGNTSDGADAPLHRLAEKTGGEFRALSMPALQSRLNMLRGHQSG